MLGKAIELAARVFAHKKDKGGKPYILHCLRVMNGVDQSDSEIMQIAVLHDVVEDFKDTNITLDDLRALGFSNRVVSGVDLLTHEEGVSYDDYIKRLALRADTRSVKRADLKDNSDITRLKGFRKKDFDRLEKYHKAYAYLSEV